MGFFDFIEDIGEGIIDVGGEIIDTTGDVIDVVGGGVVKITRGDNVLETIGKTVIGKITCLTIVK